MRILSIIVLMLALLILVAPNRAEASISNNANTKINFKLPKINLPSINFSFGKNAVAQTVPTIEPEVVLPAPKEKSADELRDEKILARWKEKQTKLWTNLPSESFIINASAYTAAADECGKSDGITSSGVKVQVNRTIACPPNYPFGTKISVEGYGTYTCEDRGGAIKGNHFDIYMETKAEAFQFGRRNLLAQVVQ